MYLTEEHSITYSSNKDLFKEIDRYCFLAKNLSNSVNYLIRQCYQIHKKLKEGEILDSWEKGMIYRANCAIYKYNRNRPGKKQLRYIDHNNGFIADAYFLSYYMKSWKVYRNMPYATCSQICIQEKCREWRSFYHAGKRYREHREGFTGRPKAPGYLDKVHGRGWIVITSQNFSIDEKGKVRMPGFLSKLHIRARHRDIKDIRIKTGCGIIRILLRYKREEPAPSRAPFTMGIDLGVENLMTICFDSERTPVIINGRPLKSINQYYNKKKASLQEKCKKGSRLHRTHAIDRLDQKRAHKIKDHLHKASRRVIDLARKENAGLIVIGNNKGWKQEVTLGKRTNQNFVSIPYRILIDMICYKARLEGIRVKVTEESYTSGTSYLDGEYPDRVHYDKSRRVKRGLFRSNSGILINADVNAAYQIMKTGGIKDLPIKSGEKITKIKVA